DILPMMPHNAASRDEVMTSMLRDNVTHARDDVGGNRETPGWADRELMVVRWWVN
ncbi:Hypothetical predicted protein, partial [Pelobates cultripes]